MCGRHTDLISLRLSKGWCQTSYRVFEKLQEILPADTASGHGIRMRVANFFFDKPIEENEEEYEKMLEIEAAKVCRAYFSTFTSSEFIPALDPRFRAGPNLGHEARGQPICGCR